MKNKIIIIYELMGLMKDGEPPKKIIFDNLEWKYDFVDNDYYGLSNNILLFQDYLKEDLIKSLSLFVEIIEENDEWEDIEEIDDIGFMCLEDGLNLLKKWTNSLIKNQKYLKERLDKDE